MMKLLPALAMCAMVLSPAVIAAKTSHYSNGPLDLAIANEDRLIEMLKRSGEIPTNASTAESEVALKKYLQRRLKESQALTHDLSDSAVAMINSSGASLHTFQTLKKNTNHHRHNYGSRPDPLQLETYSGEKRTARVLSILMEFPDFPHNSIGPDETDMYYEDYNRKHYENLLFKKGRYEGPNGEKLLTVVSYYNAQSGNSYSMEGTVAGWYMASQPAAFYGANNDGSGNDVNARELVREALLAAAADPTIDLSEFDIEDRYDLDNDGDFWEPDGLIDHIQIFHSSVGEEAGGGQLGPDAIWSHRWNLGGRYAIEGSSLEAFDYTIQPADAAAGVVAHEYGHDLGLPDEYDTNSSGLGEPVSSWSIMSSGSWAGLIPGSEPTGFSAWAKEFLQQAHGGNWLHGETYKLSDLSKFGVVVDIDQAVSKGDNNDAVRIDLPDKETVITIPTSGIYAYFSGSGDGLDNNMSVSVDLTAATEAKLQFKTWYDIETDWDYAYIMVDDGTGPLSVASNITTTENPNGPNKGSGITGNSNGWIDAEFDLSAFAGKVITLSFEYSTDGAVTNPGLYADDIMILADGNVTIYDDVDSELQFALDGFNADKGVDTTQHYYLLEWRRHRGIDKGLAHVKTRGQLLPFNQGLIIWYVDSSFTDNWTGTHPGQGFLGVVDADQKTIKWSDGNVATTRYQVHDAAFSLEHSKKLLINGENATLADNHVTRQRNFIDTWDYSSPQIPDAGRIIPKLGLKVRILSQSKDKSVVRLKLSSPE